MREGRTAGTDFKFFREFLANPMAVASPVPSGRKLAETVAAQIGLPLEGPVLELGPGTGAITRAILDRGVPAEDLVAIEYEPDFVALLRDEFPRSRIFQGDAFAFRAALQAWAIGDPFAAIISGLPVLSRPLSLRRKLLADAMDALLPGCPFVQFSYSVRPPLPAPRGVKVERAAVVWQNVPPMHVWVYTS